MQMTKFVAGLAGLAVLSGCAQIGAITKAAEFSSLQSDIDAASGVAVTMPSSGTATYSGVTLLGAKSATSSVGFMGDTHLTADFGAATISGELNNFIGVKDIVVDSGGNFTDLNDNPVSQFDVLMAAQTTTGSIAVTNGTISGSTFDADFSGTVGLAGTNYGADGMMHGNFLGATGQLIDASASCDFALNPGCSDVLLSGITDSTGAFISVKGSSE